MASKGELVEGFSGEVPLSKIPIALYLASKSTPPLSPLTIGSATTKCLI